MGIFSKTAEYLKERLGKTRDKINDSLASVLSFGRKIDDDLLNELEETLISDDIGVETTEKLISELREAYKARKISKSEEVIPFLKETIKNYWPQQDRQLHTAQTGPTVILVAGVNGAGKTTSIAKLAYIFNTQRQEGDRGRLRHVPGRRGRAADHLGRAHRRADRQAPGRQRPGGRGLRRLRGRRRAETPTC